MAKSLPLLTMAAYGVPNSATYRLSRRNRSQIVVALSKNIRVAKINSSVRRGDAWRRGVARGNYSTTYAQYEGWKGKGCVVSGILLRIYVFGK